MVDPEPFCFPLRTLLILFVEIDYWERLLFETPHYVMNVADRAEDLRILRENLLLVARDYNRWASIRVPALRSRQLPDDVVSS